MNDCIRNKAGILIGLFTLLGCFAVRAQDIAVKTNLFLGGLSQTSFFYEHFRAHETGRNIFLRLRFGKKKCSI